MTIEIKGFDPTFIKDQVDLIFEVTGNWTHEYQTSLESITKAYSSDNFDPSTRFYAFDGDNLVGYVTSDVVNDMEKGPYGTLRFPVVKDNNSDITNMLYETAETRLKELGITRIRSFAGEGLGNTLELADKFGYEKASSGFKRSKAKLSDLKTTGDTSNVIEYSKEYYDQLEDLFANVIYPGGFGEGIFIRMLENKQKKDALGLNRTSWKLIMDENGIVGFSGLSLSNRDPSQGNMPPIFFRDVIKGYDIMNNLLTSHQEKLEPHGLDKISTYISKEIFATEPLYNKLGFQFDSMYSCEKILEM